MKTLKLAAAAVAAAVLASGAALAQSTAKSEPTGAAPAKVYHAGGRHDQALHEAAVRARAKGERMPQTAMHAGGRHDARAHEAAMKAEARRATGEQPR
jgi:hypothetical protein